MIQKIKFTDSERSKLFVTGCLHINHDPTSWSNPIWKMRGYESAKEMSSGIIDRINADCRAADVLLVLGDFCLNSSREDFMEIINKINCKLWFVRGNHNNPWEKMYLEHCLAKFGHEVLNYEWLEKITYFGDYLQLEWNKKEFVCNHYPYYVFDKMNGGMVSLVSHSHGNCPLSHPGDTLSKQIDCGWDVWEKPISYGDILICANKKEVFKADHH